MLIHAVVPKYFLMGDVDHVLTCCLLYLSPWPPPSPSPLAARVYGGEVQRGEGSGSMSSAGTKGISRTAVRVASASLPQAISLATDNSLVHATR